MLERALVVQHPVGSAIARQHELAAAFGRVIVHIGGAVIGLCLFVVLLGPLQSTSCPGGSKADVTKIKVMKFAYEAYPSWAAKNPDSQCPAQLSLLAEYMNDQSKSVVNDAWGTPLRHWCWRGLLVVSAGEDGVFETADDIRSNE